MAKSGVVYECSNCGAQSPKWSGQCPECGKWNTLVESTPASTNQRSGASKAAPAAKLQKLSEIEAKQVGRITTKVEELDRVLGGGLVAGEVVLLIGEPGIGKSTLLAQLALNLSKVVYVCGEESPTQVKFKLS